MSRPAETTSDTRPTTEAAGPLRVGTLGIGRIVNRGLLPGIDGCPDVELAAAASRRPGVAADFAAGRPGLRPFDSYEALLACDEVDAVYVPCRGRDHARWTTAAAEAGKHVLCEKPLATTPAEALAMRAACREAGVVLSEAFMYRHHPRAARVIELVRGGAVGTPRVVCASFSFRIDPGDWRTESPVDGGCLWDVGSYGVNFARWVAGEEPSAVHAEAVHARDVYGDSGPGKGPGVDMVTRVGLTFPSGLIASIDCGFDVAYRCRAEVAGTAGRIELPDFFLPAGDAPLVLMAGEGGDAGAAGDGETVERFPDEDPYAHQMRHFAASVREGRLLEPGEDGVDNTAVCHAALEALHGR